MCDDRTATELSRRSQAVGMPKTYPWLWRRRLALSIAAALSGATPAAALAEQIQPVFSQDLPDLNGKTFSAVEVEFAPGTKADPHRHGQAFVFAYVLSGTVRSQLAGQAARTYRAGESWSEPPGAHHLQTQNLSRTAPARLLVVFVADAGAPLKISDTEAAPAMTATPHTGAPGAPGAPAPQQMVDALYAAFGDHHSRAVHAKGIMASGVFEPSPDAARLSKATLFSSGPLPVVVRFSDFTGIPDIPDNIGAANPRGFALKLRLPDGSDADVVTHSFNGFPTATAAEFRELLLAIGASGAGAAKPTALDSFLASHPIAKTFLTTQKPPPVSYATLSYFGVNAFAYVDAQGRRSLVRYRFTPHQGEAYVPDRELAAKGPNYLRDELPARLAGGPVAFDWYAQVGGPNDVAEDPSVAWPEDRPLVKLGTVRVDHIVPDQDALEKATIFRPLNVPAGIAPADPMLEIRHSAYPLSFNHRQ